MLFVSNLCLLLKRMEILHEQRMHLVCFPTILGLSEVCAIKADKTERHLFLRFIFLLIHMYTNTHVHTCNMHVHPLKSPVGALSLHLITCRPTVHSSHLDAR